MPPCKHEKVKEINVVVVSGLIARKMKVCELCGEVLESKDYEIEGNTP